MKGVLSSVCIVALAALTFAAADKRFTKTRKEWTPESNINPHKHVEGDIELPAPEAARTGMVDEKYRWPKGKVPYVFSPKFPKMPQKVVKKVMDEFAWITSNCITFHERKNEKDYIMFDMDETKACSSQVGRIGGMQLINYNDWCFEVFGTVQHEILHALGFLHEQSRYDRDNYVTILWQNINPNKYINFYKVEKHVADGFGEKYDYNSVMHYPAHAYTRNGKETIVTKDPKAVIGQRDDLSPVDIKKLKKMYKC